MSSDPRTLISALRNSHDRLVSLVSPLSPEQLAAQSYDTDWTIAQVLSHLGSGAEIATLSLAAVLAGRGQVDGDAVPAIWEAWNNRSPQAQAADSLTWDGEYVRRLEQLTGADLDSISLDLSGHRVDAAGLVLMRLGEHAVHVWDIAVSIDPRATVAADAVPLLFGYIPGLFQYVAKPAGDSFRVRVRTTQPDGDYLLTVADPVTLAEWDQPGTGVDGEVRLPAEAMLRLCYGRLDPEHTPDYSAEGIDLDRLRRVFPGF